MTTATPAAHWTYFIKKPFERSVSDEGMRSRQSSKPIGGETPSITVDQAYEESIRALLKVFKEASRPGWDGYHATEVSSATIGQALEFLDWIPSRLPKPEVSAHPDGQVGFEWWVGPRRVVTVSVNESGQVNYAALIEQDCFHGTMMLRDSFPETISAALSRIFLEA